MEGGGAGGVFVVPSVDRESTEGVAAFTGDVVAREPVDEGGRVVVLVVLAFEVALDFEAADGCAGFEVEGRGKVELFGRGRAVFFSAAASER
jgi:hypothetical protein